MSWTFTETNQFDQPAVERLGNKFLLGNGYIGYRGTLEEYTKGQKVAVIVSGLYDKVGDQWREPINLPNGGYIQLLYRGVPLHVQTSQVEQHSQTLDIQQGLHERQTTFLAEDGTTITVHSIRFVSLAAPHLMAIRYTLQASRDCALTLHTGIDGDVWDLNGPHLEDFAAVQADGLLSLTARTHELKVPVAVSEYLIGVEGEHTYRAETQRILRENQLAVKAGQPVVVAKFVTFYTGIDAQDPLATGQQLCAAAAQQGFDRLLQAHHALWAERWQQCDVQIVGDETAQSALRFSLYHLMAIAPTHATTVSIPARGLSGQVYKGGIFWDTEIFMLPFFIHAFPAIARNLLLYRYHTLTGARRKAAEYGFRGAFYAWESQDNGDDACTLFNITDVFTDRPTRTYFRDKQYHISADVAYAFWNYFANTGDDSIWLEGGAEVVCECARFFVSLAYYRPDKDRYEIPDVTGPDEYHERVHNNTYTNWMIAHTFDVCVQVCNYLGEHYPHELQALMDRLDFWRDLQAIRDISSKLYQPAPDPVSSVIPQFDGYFTLEDVTLHDLLQRKLHPHEYLGGGNGLATTTQIIKQADVVLTLFLFNAKIPREIKAANWRYYEPRTEHGSSLSACSYALIAAHIGQTEWAYRYFMKTAEIDLIGDSKQYVGTLYIGGTHPAANGGAWLAAVFGLCGISTIDSTIIVEPHLPDRWQEVTLPFMFRGQRLTIKLSRERVVVRSHEPMLTEIFVRVGGKTHRLAEIEEISLHQTRSGSVRAGSD